MPCEILAIMSDCCYYLPERGGRMKYRLIASDMDGTLLTTDKRISKRNLEAVRRYADSGGIFCLCTGRTIAGIKRYAEELALPFPIIAANGAVVALPDGRVLYEVNMSAHSAMTVYSVGAEMDLSMCIWAKERLYISRRDVYTNHYERVIGVEAQEIENVGDVIEKGVLKVIWFAEPERMPELYERLEKCCPPDTCWANSTERMIEFNDYKVSKATAMAFIGEKYGIDRENMLAIGDNFNDLPMLNYAGMSVAMGNAPEEVKKQSRFVTETNDNDGVAGAIEKFALDIGD